MPNLPNKLKYHILGKPFKIVITGPESSGKTTIALALAKEHNVHTVPEFARTYLQFLGRPYRPEDLATIFRGQMAWEDFYTTSAPELIICDTDWTVLQVWENNLNRSNPFPFPRRPWDLALLCAPDMPWQEDPLREHPQDRDRLFQEYLELLRSTGLPFVALLGSHDKRMTTAMAAIQSL